MLCFGSWVDFINNPVTNFNPENPDYCCVIYNPSGVLFYNGQVYKFAMYFSDAYLQGIYIAGSNDGQSWILLNEGNPVNGIVSTAKRPCVIANFDEWGMVNYKMWYWDTSQVSTVEAIRYAESIDGINWMHDRPISGELVNSSAKTNWNFRIKGCCVVFQPEKPGSLDLENPINNRYIMVFAAASYYSQIDEEHERICAGLAYSANGVDWKLYGRILDYGGPWDYKFVFPSSLVKGKDGVWRIWYSGGENGPMEGIGYAESEDGLIWKKLDFIPGIGSVAGGAYSNPLKELGPCNGLGELGSWNADGNGFPWVLRDSNCFEGSHEYYMWRIGKNGDSWSVGFAYADPPSVPLPVYPLNEGTLPFVEDLFYLEWGFPSDPQSDRLHFEVEVDGEVFSTTIQTEKFSVIKDGKLENFPSPSDGGVANCERVRIYPEINVNIERHTWRVRSRDKQFYSLWTSPVTFTLAEGEASVGTHGHFVVYPNPVIGTSSLRLMVKLRFPENVSVRIYSISGRLVFKKVYSCKAGVQVLNISTDGIAPGVYSIVVNVGPSIKGMRKILVIK